MPTASRERAAAASAAKLAEGTETPIVIDANDPDTIAANNSGGRVTPSNTDNEYLALFAGTVFDADAPITKATVSASKARKGRAGKSLLEERDTNALTLALSKITSEEGEADDAVFGYAMFVKHDDFVNKKSQTLNWVKDHNLTGVSVSVSFAKHAVSKTGYDPKKISENKGKPMVYAVTLTRGDETEETEEGNE
jgi:hypothetical protein